MSSLIPTTSTNWTLIHEHEAHREQTRCASRYSRRLLPHHQFIGLLQILRRDGGVQLPRDVHGTGALMLDIARRAEVGIRCRGVQYPVRLKLPDEQQHPAPLLPMVDIPLAGG